MSRTAVILIGNSDDKLSQATWSAYCADVEAAVSWAAGAGAVVHFAGAAHASAPWQNAAWAVLLPADGGVRDELRTRLARIAGEYRQESVAWVEAEPEFLSAAGTTRS